MATASSVHPESQSISRAWYGDPIRDFLRSDTTSILGTLAKNGDFTLLTTQRDTWIAQIEFLRSALTGLDGAIFFEFNIPRMGRRVDVVLIISSIVFALEFKVGEQTFDRAAIDQVWDYALDLKNFHEASHTASILPVLIATEARDSEPPKLIADTDQIYRPISVATHRFRALVDTAIETIQANALDAGQWVRAPYRPTPTIVEAARSLYAQHSVDAIARFDAGAKNLKTTSQRVEALIEEARRTGRKIICFVTGVPGAGKTLVGLNVATLHRRQEEPTHAVFLSGNGPLVAVLREALTRDEVSRKKGEGEKVRKSQIAESVKAFIQNVHHFRDDALHDPAPPIEHVVIFDEAQRAWNLRQTANFMQRKKGCAGFAQSEPEFLISCMDRKQDWAVIVCLVGGGQEINIGEAGIDAWLEAIHSTFPHWHVYISDKLVDSEYAAGAALQKMAHWPQAHFDQSLHLSVSMRSFRAEHVSSFVKAMLDCERDNARATLAQFIDKYPVVLTRDLKLAKQWIRAKARGSERFGLVASSKAQRLKPHAIDIRVDVDPVHWFLNDKDDTRSSYYLEDAATEFQVQGLELDWACVTWDGDLRFTEQGWTYHDFRGNRWTNISNADNRNYLRNAYRVLLTRARQGMVIFVPPGEPSDPTRSASCYDPTFEYLASVGIPMIPQ